MSYPARAEGLVNSTFCAYTLGKGMNPVIRPSDGLNLINTVLLSGWLWRHILYEAWYAVKLRSESKSILFAYFITLSLFLLLLLSILSTLSCCRFPRTFILSVGHLSIYLSNYLSIYLTNKLISFLYSCLTSP